MTTNDEIAAVAESSAPPWTWLPTLNGAIRRRDVSAVSVERIDGDFKGGRSSMWLIDVTLVGGAEPVRLRPTFFDATELCWWVDRVFPGAAFTLLPPEVIEASPDYEPSKASVRNVTGDTVAKVIRSIGEGLGQGNAYEPDQGYRPPPGAAPRAI